MKIFLFFFLIIGVLICAAKAPVNAAAVEIIYLAPAPDGYSPPCQKFASAFNDQMMKWAEGELGIAPVDSYTFPLMEVRNQHEWFIGLFWDFPYRQPKDPDKPLEPMWRAEVKEFTPKKIKQLAKEAVKILRSHVEKQEREKWSI